MLHAVRLLALAPAVALGALGLVTGFAGHADAANVGLVSARGGQFVLNGAPFRFVGTNAYFLTTATASGAAVDVDQMLAMANDLGFTVMRTSAFADGTSTGPALQPAPGVYSEEGFRALDYVLYKADLAGVRLILTLVNYWTPFGGMPQYVAWCAPGAPVDAFYTDPGCRDLYRRYVAHMIGRVNSYNGRRYADDPTIFAWELANEPRSSDPTGGTVRRWVGEMAAYVKSLDPAHMVGTGEEGFDATAAGYTGLAAYNGQGWMFAGGAGVAFTANTQDPNIDFGSIHLYVEDWNLVPSSGGPWIADHVRIARQLGKPLLLGEFGVGANTAAVITDWLETVEAEGGAGALFWQIICQACQNYAGLSTVYPPHSDVSTTLAAAAAQANASGGAGGLGLTLSGAAFRAGDSAQVSLFAPDVAGAAVDVYFGVLLPADAGPPLGCPQRDAAAFMVDGYTGVSVACLSSAPSSFGRLYANAAPGSLSRSFSFVWSPAMPAGRYTFFLALTRPGALAKGVVDNRDILAIATRQAIFQP